MKIHENVLPLSLLNKCIDELVSYEKAQVWGISNCFWEEGLKEGLSGTVSMTMVSKEISSEIHTVLEKYFSKIMGEDYNIMYQYYIWNKLSGIASHNDAAYELGATLYLNKTWDINFGGLFVWKEKGEKISGYKLNALCPKQNMLVINDECEEHVVTPTAHNIPYPRITIQIWAKKKIRNND